MRLLDTDVMIDILRNYPPALTWFESLQDEEAPGLPGFVVMELMQGGRNVRELRALRRRLEPFNTYWPAPEDCNRVPSTLIRTLP